MSLRRFVSTLAGAAPVLAAAAILGWHAFPLIAANPSDAPGVEVNDNGFHMLHRAGIDYPAEAVARHTGGEVVASVSVDDRGEVADARIISGPQALRGAVLASVLKWHFDPEQKLPDNRSFEISVRFTPPAEAGQQPAEGWTEPASATIDSVDVSRLPVALRERAASALRGHEGETLSTEQLRELTASLRAVDSHLHLGFFNNGQNTVLQPVLESETAPQPKRIRVGGGVQQLNLVQKPMPVYPAEAKQAHLQGSVKLRAIIAADGRVKELTPVTGPPVLVTAAVDAVKNWVYRPTLLNGEPVEVVTDIDVNFTLAE